MSGEHSRLLPASGAPSWGHCSGSAVVNATTPDHETEDSRRGTATHELAAQVLNVVKGAATGSMACDGYVGQAVGNGVIVDSSMAAGAQVAVDYVLGICQEHGALQSLLVEHRVHMPQIHAENWGTTDIAIPLLDVGVIYVIDFKFGHRDNRAKENLQLIDYAAGLYNELKIDGHAAQHIKVVFGIVQPFSYHGDGPINEWECVLSDLRPYWNQLQAQADDIIAGNLSMTTGKWCRDCPAVGKCAAARKAGYRMFDYVKAPYEIDLMSGPSLATERLILQTGVAAAKSRLEAVEDELKHRVGQGATDTGLILEATEGRSAWTVPMGQAKALALQFGVDADKPGILTPTQTADKVAKELRPSFKQVQAGMTSRPAGKLKLINASDSSVAAAFKRK